QPSRDGHASALGQRTRSARAPRARSRGGGCLGGDHLLHERVPLAARVAATLPLGVFGAALGAAIGCFDFRAHGTLVIAHGRSPWRDPVCETCDSSGAKPLSMQLRSATAARQRSPSTTAVDARRRPLRRVVLEPCEMLLEEQIHDSRGSVSLL